MNKQGQIILVRLKQFACLFYFFLLLVYLFFSFRISSVSFLSYQSFFQVFPGNGTKFTTIAVPNPT